jgi:uncharacterized RDD family membrane protein YckC
MTDLAHVDSCPFCEQPMGDKRKLLYGHPVCRKCYFAFANRRQIAFVLDRVVWFIPMMVLTFGCIAIVQAMGQKLTPDVVRAVDMLQWPTYIVFLVKDGFWGYSPGKWVCGVQTIDKKTREPAGFWASLKRNLPVFIPIVPLVIAYQLQNGKRMGDGWANTMVIWKKYEKSRVFAPEGCCEACGYDLHGNVTGVCPECGTAVSVANSGLVATEGRT